MKRYTFLKGFQTSLKEFSQIEDIFRFSDERDFVYAVKKQVSCSSL